ncbi:hypothetical protein HPP92_002545 [Vanilla planifolia]|uniref:HTH myb-type domain-containing protein n=1 Tax=Vanilla planifolia TaxID=51239 RepID=A0A835RTL5_VANPL|nr:hypothetical protein HPP92_002545 [Vanilla planifolia]
MLRLHRSRGRPALSFEEQQRVGFQLKFDGEKEMLSVLEADLMVEGNLKEAMDGIDGVFRTASPVFLVGDVQDTLLDPAIKGIMTEEEPPCDWSAFDSLDLPMEFPELETLLTNLLDQRKEEIVLQPTIREEAIMENAPGMMMEEEPPCEWSAFGSLDLPMEFPEQETLLTNLLNHWEEEEEAIQQPTVPMATTSATESSHLEVTEMTCDLLLINDRKTTYDSQSQRKQEEQQSFPAAEQQFHKLYKERLFLKLVEEIGWGKWKLIATIMKTKTASQVTSHAQKYLNRRKGETKRKSINDVTFKDLYVLPLSTHDASRIPSIQMSKFSSLGASTFSTTTSFIGKCIS